MPDGAAPPGDRLRAAYDPERFRRAAHRAADLAADYLAQATGRDPALPVLPWTPPEAAASAWPSAFSDPPQVELDALLARVLAESTHLHHPRHTGHQVPPPLPVTAATDLVAGLLNNSLAIYEMGPAGAMIERAVIQWLADAIGYGPAAGGVITSGGSLGNLTALLAARQAGAGFDAWTEGTAGAPLAVLVSEQAHYCVGRAAQVMGWGRGGVVTVPVDGQLRLRADALPEAAARAEAAGRRVVAVVASACGTAAGTYDPLEAMADFCAARGLWFHVDGAHGAAAALSDRYRHLVAGIERADSVVWDAHKMLLTPSLTTAVLYRDGRRADDAFAQDASYLYERSAREEWYNLSHRTLECTKPMAALRLYAALAVHGPGLFSDFVTSTFDLARDFAARVAAAPDFTVPHDPESNIVCFRYRTADTLAAGVDALQSRVRRRLIAGGAFYVSQVRLPTGLHLRVTLMNPLTTAGDLDALIEAVRAAGVDG
ncbi:MAG: aspartate aminotransferase family protein [Gemmatimonadota bacterium]